MTELDKKDVWDINTKFIKNNKYGWQSSNNIR